MIIIIVTTTTTIINYYYCYYYYYYYCYYYYCYYYYYYYYYWACPVARHTLNEHIRAYFTYSCSSSNSLSVELSRQYPLGRCNTGLHVSLPKLWTRLTLEMTSGDVSRPSKNVMWMYMHYISIGIGLTRWCFGLESSKWSTWFPRKYQPSTQVFAGIEQALYTSSYLTHANGISNMWRPFTNYII